MAKDGIKKPIHKRWWFWLIVVLFCLVVIGNLTGGSGNKSAENTTESSAPSSDDTTTDDDDSGNTSSDDTDSESDSAESSSSESSSKADVPTEYLSALDKAESYAKGMNMSKQAVYEQLTSEYGEKFSAQAAQYAIDHLTDVDWNANALAKARSYQSDMSMSPEAIRDQLTSDSGEKFTPDEANYAIQHLNDK
ncbi:Ltp family lipoprotein [Lacticaseibacillus paracasei]|uniref:Ltp family lipoprotein n=1 Tax=Lacticaseibacillus paracasei TaxID=1597 RepID=UPI0008DD1ABA|nr:Ltp family lipoprotein [Lacticaseibacillus paracasei]OHY53184.1 hypothetical protein BBX46_07670 [Lacticaseibacillus paracasei]